MQPISPTHHQTPCHPWKGLSTCNPVQAANAGNKNVYFRESYAPSTAHLLALSESDATEATLQLRAVLGN